MCAHGFRCYFTPLPGCFSPFPHGTSALSVIRSYLALEGGPPCFRQGFTCPALLGMRTQTLLLRLQACHLLRGGFPSRFVSDNRPKCPSHNPGSLRFGLFPLRSPLLRESRLISFPPATEMFQFTGLASQGLCVQPRDSWIAPGGFSHSDTSGSMAVCASPELFAACRVLLRRRMPRHPPCALYSLILLISSSGSFALFKR